MNMPTLIREHEARRRLGDISRTTFWRFRQDGLIPEPVVIRAKNYYVAADFDAAVRRLISPNSIQSTALAHEVPHD